MEVFVYNEFMRVVGIDEVGRGCWAGPVVAGAVLLDDDIPGLRDSKVLSKKRRAVFSEQIHAAATVGLGWVTPTEVDRLGLTAAVGLAMQRALDQIAQPYEQIIIDGNYNFMPNNPKVITIIRADDTVPAVSAASIIAKVARDEYMAQLSAKYPMYGFTKHVGYGTETHRKALQEHGVTPEHRKSYKPIQALLQ